MCSSDLILLHYNEPAMPKSISQTELDTICRVVAGFSAGASVEDIYGTLMGELSRRTLQRRLALLVTQHRLVSEGAGRGCRYRLPMDVLEGKVAMNCSVRRNDVLAQLARLKPELTRRFGVTRLALFGSTVRDEARPDSDIDIVVVFDGPATSSRYFGVLFLLEDELGRSIDLVTDKAMRVELRPFIEREAVNV